MLIELTPTERHDQEVALPKIFDNGLHTDRIEWYTRLTVESGLIRGGVTVIPEFIAAMICEAGLDNRRFGDANPDPDFGLYWVQLDTAHHAPQTTPELVRFRSDPLIPLQYVAGSSDLTTHTPNRTEFNKKRWNAWKPTTIDPPDIDGVPQWSPFKAALDAWSVVTNQGAPS